MRVESREALFCTKIRPDSNLIGIIDDFSAVPKLPESQKIITERVISKCSIGR
jgi:hypothetical protein